jgi:hypothetical protein
MARAPSGTRVYMGTFRIDGARDSLIELARTEVIKRPSELALPFLEKRYVLFGDESTASDIVTYGLVCFDRPSHANSATFAFQRAISDAGAPADSRVHSRELFSGEARKKTPWRHLTENETWQLGEKLIEGLRDHYARFFLGVVYKDTFPKQIPNGPGRTVQIKNEHCYAFGFISAAAALSHGIRLQTGEKIRGLVFVDPQAAKATFWGLGHVQIQQLMNSTGLTPVPGAPNDHLLLDAADLFAYSAARALSEAPARNKAMCERILAITRPGICRHFWAAEGIPPKMVERLSLGSGLGR